MRAGGSGSEDGARDVVRGSQDGEEEDGEVHGCEDEFLCCAVFRSLLSMKGGTGQRSNVVKS